MPPFMSASKVICSVLSRKARARQLINSAQYNSQLRRPDQIFRFGSIPGVKASSIRNLIGCRDHIDFTSSSFASDAGFLQRRQFLGCGDGEEGDGLSKVYEERRVLGYSPEQLFDVVAAVDLYHGFVPWCQRSEIVRYNPDGSFNAELEIGFKFLVESYVSHVELEKPRLVKSTVSDSGLFDHLINIWEFNPGPVPGSCSLYFLVDFKFQSPLYRQAASMFFKEVALRLVSSFNERCRLIYGPGVPVIENSYEQKV